MPNLFAITPAISKTSLTVASASHTSQPPAHASPPASIFWSPSFQSTYCYFLGGPSQSTMGGCQGSNPYTMISLLLTKTYPNSRVLFQQHHIQSMDQSWVVAFISCMTCGNHVHDAYFHTYLPWCWRGHTTVVKYSLSRVSYEQELTVQYMQHNLSFNTWHQWA